jgi:hypothetical protein
MASDEPSLYDYLATSQISEVTAAQLEQATEKTYVRQRNVSFWKGPITVHQVIKASRTYPHGLPIPEKGVATGEAVGTEATAVFQPSGTEVWMVEALSITAAAGTPTCTVSLFNGSVAVAMHSGNSSTTESSFYPWEAPLLITNSLYLQIANADNTNAVTAKIAYQVVGL